VTNVVIAQLPWLPLNIFERLWAVNAVSLETASKVLKLLPRKILKRRWFRFLFLGGGSALFELQIGATITSDDLQVINRASVVERRWDF
jgi:hypothetical protein